MSASSTPVPGIWVTNGGYEYNLVPMAAVFAITAAGPGRWALDEQLGTGSSGSAAAVAQLGAGVLGAATAIRLGSQNGAADEAEPAASEEAAPEREPVAVGV
jgi:putative oxidoreductase